MRIRLISALACALLVFAGRSALSEGTPEATANPTPATREVQVHGRVVYGTTGGQLPSALTLTLHTIGIDTTALVPSGPVQLDVRDAAMAADGRFAFSGVPGQDGYNYVITARYAGGVLYSAPVTLAAGKTDIDLPFTIYEASSDPAIVQMTRIINILDFASVAGVIQVYSGYSFTATGDHVFLSKDKMTDGNPISVSILLPADAQNMSADNTRNPDKLHYLIDGLTLKDTLPVMPGQQQQVSVGYQIRYPDSATIVQPLPYGAGEFQVLIPTVNDKITLTGDGFSAGEPYSFGTDTVETFRLYKHELVSPGGSVTFEVKGAPAQMQIPPGLLPPPDMTPYFLAGGGAILLAIAAVLFLTGRRNPKP